MSFFVFRPQSFPTTSRSVTPPLEELPPPKSPTPSLPELPPIDYEDRAGNTPKPAQVNGFDQSKSGLFTSSSCCLVDFCIFLFSSTLHLHMMSTACVTIRASGTCTAAERCLLAWDFSCRKVCGMYRMVYAKGLKGLKKHNKNSPSVPFLCQKQLRQGRAAQVCQQ